MALLPPENIHDEWSVSLLDLPAYVHRIGYSGPLAADYSTLNALHRAHVAAFPFETLDVALGRPPALDLESIQTKLIAGNRGGYCYEQNLLFAAVLERIGFRVHRLAGRVRIHGAPIPARTHMVLVVNIGGGEWLADVGFGSSNLIEAILLQDGCKAVQNGWSYALVRDGAEWILRGQWQGELRDLYTFELAEQHLIDYTVANHYIATHANSPFAGRIILQRTAGETRCGLAGRRFTESHSDGRISTEQLDDDSFSRVLGDVFGVEVTSDDLRRLIELLPNG